MCSNGRIISAKSIHDYIQQKHENCSINTIIKYLSYLKEAYIIETIKQYSTRTKSELAYYLKIYNEDVALNSIRCMDNRYDLTHNLENIVYNENTTIIAHSIAPVFVSKFSEAMIEGMKNRGINIERINYQDNEKIKEIEIYKNLQIYMWAVSKKLIKPWVNYETL